MQRLNLVVNVNNRMNVIDVKDAVQVRTSYSFISPHKKQNKNKLYNLIYIKKYIIYKYILSCSLHAVTSSVCTDIHIHFFDIHIHFYTIKIQMVY